MTLSDSIDALANQITSGTVSDLKHIVDVREAFVAIQGSLTGDELREALTASEEALEALGAILWQEAQDPAKEYEYLDAVVQFIKDTAEALEKGLSQTKSRPTRPGQGTAERVSPEKGQVDSDPAEARELKEEPIDLELISMFLANCEENLEVIERLAMEIEKESCQESIDHLRRVAHTIKGECGVLSLETAQHLFHVAEDRLDDTLSAGKDFPAEGVLALADWLKAYVEALSSDPSSAPPATEAVLEAFEAVAQIDKPTSGSSNTATAPSSVESPTTGHDEAEPNIEKGSVFESKAAAKFFAGHPDEEDVTFDPEVFEDPMIGDVLSEGRSHLEDAEAAILELENDPGGGQLIDRIFRAFHTIKGVAGFMNLTAVVEVAHGSETLLDDFRKGYQACTKEHVNLVFRSRDIMAALLDALSGEAAPTIGSIRALLYDLEYATVGEGGVPRSKSPSRSKSESSSKSVNAPDSDASEAPKQAPVTPQTPEATSPVESTPQATGESSDAIKPAPRAQAGVASDPKSKGRAATKIEQSVKVGTKRLDQIVDMVGELVIAQQMVSQDETIASLHEERLTRNLAQVAKITRDLQESAMSLRMVPLRSTFQKMARLVRDVSRKAGRSVALEIGGEDTELDRTVVEEIGDPLIHLVRNAIDHGLEPSDERIATGKEEVGNLALRAYHQGGSIVIEIQDDGRGLDREKLLAKAQERNILPAGTRPEDMTDSEVFKLIFAAGFSTAEKVTDISGRGVGMDVVRRNIESLRGRIDIKSELGKGTTFYLRLPLTLAIIDGMIVRVGGIRYVVPTLSIEQSFQPTPEQLHSVMEAGLAVEVRDSLLPTRSLKDLFGLETGTDEPTEGILIILEAHGERTCVLVDEILYQQQVVIKTIGKAVPSVQGISGAAILGDGTVALILDVDSLLTEAPKLAA